MSVSELEISIHIPRVGDDPELLSDIALEGISIHIPRVGDDDKAILQNYVDTLFQSTSPVWGMTPVGVFDLHSVGFQSTSPVWGMTGRHVHGCGVRRISIHIPRVGDDPQSTLFLGEAGNFNPHPPCGG